MRVVFTIVGAVVPALLLMRYFYKRDLNPEPRGILVMTFVLGVLIVIPLTIVAFPMQWLARGVTNPLLSAAFYAFLCAAIPEESMKFLVITRYCARREAFDELMDGVVYGATASLGFAALENIMYVAHGGWPAALLRAFTAVPAHACFGAIMGYYVARARLGLSPASSRWKGLCLAVLLHGLYDLPLFAMRGVFLSGWCVGSPARTTFAMVGGHATCLAALVYSIRRVQHIVRELHRTQVREATGLQ